MSKKSKHPKETKQDEHGIQDIFKKKKKNPKEIGHKLKDKRPHFKSFKSPGEK